MAKKIDPIIKEVLDRYGIDPRRALWDCHGTWIIYHKYVEMIAAKAGATLDLPTVVHADPGKQLVVILVSGKLGEREEWSFGEAAPKNNKNAYPFAMAEKRAKDRVILKLVGLAGHVYTDVDAYEVSGNTVKWEAPAEAQHQASGDDLIELIQMIADADNMPHLEAAAAAIRESDLSTADKAQLRKDFTLRRKEINNG